jgi:hypothetical protein
VQTVAGQLGIAANALRRIGPWLRRSTGPEPAATGSPFSTLLTMPSSTNQDEATEGAYLKGWVSLGHREERVSLDYRQILGCPRERRPLEDPQEWASPGCPQALLDRLREWVSLGHREERVSLDYRQILGCPRERRPLEDPQEWASPG